MVRQYAIIGLGKFGRRILDELLAADAEVLLIDKDPEAVAEYEDTVQQVYIVDALKEEAIRRLVPPDVNAAVVDLVKRIEVSILVTNYLKKLGVARVVATAENEEHGEVLSVVGADQVIFPNREAAKRVAPTLLSTSVFNYLPLESGLSMAEIEVPPRFVDHTIIEADFRRATNLYVVAVRSAGNIEYRFVAPDYRMQERDTLLVASDDASIRAFSRKTGTRAGNTHRRGQPSSPRVARRDDGTGAQEELARSAGKPEGKVPEDLLLGQERPKAAPEERPQQPGHEPPAPHESGTGSPAAHESGEGHRAERSVFGRGLFRRLRARFRER